jgi:tetratricopeptide (TPR) repeat protein
LDEIERSRPFFLGLIGDRYGWTPPCAEMEAAVNDARFPLDDFDMSVTALEIEYGALRLDEPPICLFYFRESPDYSAVPKELRGIYRDGEENLHKLERLKSEIRARFGADVMGYTAEVCESGLTVSKDWADTVAADITEKLRIEWGEPPDAPPNRREREREEQKLFRERRTEHFAGREAVIAELVDFCLNDEPEKRILMLQGEAGSGKSGILCKVMDKCLLLPFCCGISPQSSLAEDILKSFISALCEHLGVEDDDDKTVRFSALKNRFFELLNIACQDRRVIAVVDALDQLTESEAARRMLWISGKLPEGFRLLCSVIEGPETDAVKALGGEVRPVPAISDADALAIINSMAIRHRKQISGAVAEHILRKQTENGLGKKQAAQNPLYLSLILQDLVMMDRYELDAVQRYMEGGMSHSDALTKFMCRRIDETPGDAEGAYLAILKRLEGLIGRDFIRASCGMIVLSRSGLRETDIEGAFAELGMEFNAADFSWLRQMLRGHFVQGDAQQWDFAHQSLRRGLIKDMQDELSRLNDGLTACFRKQAVYDSFEERNAVHMAYKPGVYDNFAMREIIHHLFIADKSEWAAEVLATCHRNHRGMLVRAIAEMFEGGRERFSRFLTAMLTSAGKSENIDITEYQRIINAVRMLLPALPDDSIKFKVELMQAALALLTEHDEQADNMMLQTAANGEMDIADLYAESNEGEMAEEFYQKARLTMNRINVTYDLTVLFQWGAGLLEAYNRMGDYFMSLGQSETAGIYIGRAVDLAEELYNNSLMFEHTSLKNLSVSYADELLLVYDKMGRIQFGLSRADEAAVYARKSVELSETLNKRINTANALLQLAISKGVLGYYLMISSETAEAAECYRAALEGFGQIYRQGGAQAETALSALANAYTQIAEHVVNSDGAQEELKCFRDVLDGIDGIFMQCDLSDGLCEKFREMALYDAHAADAFASRSLADEATAFLQKALNKFKRIYELTEMTDALKELAVTYARVGTFLLNSGRTGDAEAYFVKNVEMMADVFNHSNTVSALYDLIQSYENMGFVLMKSEKVGEACLSYEKACEALGMIAEHSGTAEALKKLLQSQMKMIDRYMAQNRFDDADSYYAKAFGTAMKINDAGNPMEAVTQLVTVNDRMGDAKYAAGLSEEAHRHRTDALKYFRVLTQFNPDAEAHLAYFEKKAGI